MKRLEDLTEPELRDLMNQVGFAVESVCMVRGIGKPLFSVLIFNDPAVAQYVANCRREDIIKAIRETADRLEARQDVTR